MARSNAQSGLPSELNENWGSNYMLDGFWHDMDYEKGLRDNPGSQPIPQPSTSGFSHLPDGVLVSEDCGGFHDAPDSVDRETDGAMDLGGLEIVAAFDPASDISSTGVVDHAWLADAFQDPDRLPDNPVDDGISELSNAWGDRTDGLLRVDLYERESVQPNLGERREDDDTLNQDKLASLVRSAMRRSAAGVPFKTIFRDLHGVIGTEGIRRISKSLQVLNAEHGLVGSVYVRASAYPGLHQGKWSKELQRAAKTAQFLVKCPTEDSGACAQALGLMEIANPNQINWDRAFAHYAPQLKAAGRLQKLAGSKRETLRQAFLREGIAPNLQIEATRVPVTMPMDLVTASEAREALANAPAVERQVVVNDRDEKIAQQQLKVRLGSFVKARLLSSEEAETLARSTAPPILRMKMAELLAARTKTASYKGAVQGDRNVHISEREFQAATAAQDTKASTEEIAERRRVLAQFVQMETVRQGALRKVQKVAALVEKGAKGPKLLTLVDRLFGTRERRLVASSLDPILVQGKAFETQASMVSERPVIREAIPQKPKSTVSPREIQAALSWVRRQMNEGFVGADLTYLLKQRITTPVLKAASEQLVQLRRQHEGLAGHLYVDASAYASPEGTKGCDEGGLQHRTNGIKLLMPMERCGACVFRNANSVCQKYNKQIVDRLPETAVEFRRQVLAAARMTDAEATASMFMDSTSNVVSEFGLHNAALDNVETAEAEHNPLDGVFFGGFEV